MFHNIFNWKKKHVRKWEKRKKERERQERRKEKRRKGMLEAGREKDEVSERG